MDDLTWEEGSFTVGPSIMVPGRLVTAGEGCGSHNMEKLWLSQGVEVKSLKAENIQNLMVKLWIGIIFFEQTIFLPYFFMTWLHLNSPFFLTDSSLLRLSHRFFSLQTWVSALLFPTTTAAADDQGQNEGSSDHRHGDNQSFKINPAYPPAGILQFT